MGTVVSIRVPDADAPDEAARASLAQCIERARMAFDDLDEKFSLYRETSEASRIARGEIPLAQSSSDMRDAYAKALEWRTATNYTFTITGTGLTPGAHVAIEIKPELGDGRLRGSHRLGGRNARPDAREKPRHAEALEKESSHNPSCIRK
jgi:hypothetical protein